jgi:peptidoglycan/LPS O-acetylase OafA/YrhL
MLVLNLFFLNQIFTSTSFVGPAWTLATEVWLYCLAPLFLKLNFKQLFAIIYTSLICYCAYTCGRTLFHWNYYSGTQYGINLLFLAFIWVIGFTLAVYPQNKKFISINIALIFLLHIGLTAGIQGLHRYKHQELSHFFLKDLIVYVAKSICLTFVYYVVIYNGRIPKFSKHVNKLFNVLGNISYPLYLTHIITFKLLTKLNINNVALMIAFALVISYFIYWAFDSYSKKRDIKAVSHPSRAVFGLTNES